MRALVPPDVDLRDFAFMPLDVQRLLTSETWILGNGDERAAAMTLWLTSWHQVPAGSLPENDRMLERLADCRNWKKAKAHALRGWAPGGDGRLYHPVVCEKALEAWLEKLAQRLSSGAGNAKRWGAEFDSSPLEARMQEARDLLIGLNPDSRTLTKRRTSGLPKASRPDPDGNPDGIPSGSQETEKGQGQGEEEQEQNPPNPPAVAGGEKGSRKKPQTTFPTFLDACRAAGEKPIRADDPLFQFATDAGIPREFIVLAWWDFARKHAESGRRQKDWRAHFRDAVRRNWAKLWWMRDDGCELTTVGVAVKREREAELERQKAEREEHAA